MNDKINKLHCITLIDSPRLTDVWLWATVFCLILSEIA